MRNRRLILLLSTGLVLLTTSGMAQSTCPESTNVSNFNGTSIQPGSWIWFNANLSASGVPSTGTTIFFTGSTITFTADQTYTLEVPNAQVTFDPSVVCASTSFDTASNTWLTTVPSSGSDEVFLTGVAFQVPADFATVNGRVKGPVDWQGTFESFSEGISVSWKWGAAVYESFSSDYNVLGIKPAHTHACLYVNSDHAGTPEGVDPASGQPFKGFVVGGARGGGGSNWTGSWSGTQAVSVCPSGGGVG